MSDTSTANGSFVRKLKRGIGAILVTIGVVYGLWSLARHISGRPRVEWKSAALERLRRLSIADAEIRHEIDELKKSNTNNTELGWAHEHVLLMGNGEYIIYEYRHGANIYFPPHLFLGHGSDGRWLYSSFHFCNDINMVRYAPPPASINEFEQKYSVREFDGKSNDCLKMTQ